jgi:hypothetical protein
MRRGIPIDIHAAIYIFTLYFIIGIFQSLESYYSFVKKLPEKTQRPLVSGLLLLGFLFCFYMMFYSDFIEFKVDKDVLMNDLVSGMGMNDWLAQRLPLVMMSLSSDISFFLGAKYQGQYAGVPLQA